jgi:uncharacterized protein
MEQSAMRRFLRFVITGSVALAAGLTGCRQGIEGTETAEAVAEIPLDPWAFPPPDSLYGAPAVENLRVVEAVLEARGIPRGWDGMRVAVLSDFLLGSWRDNDRVAAAAVRRAVDSDPDLIVLLGNYLGEGGDPSALQGVLGGLGGRPTLAILGPRDVPTDSMANAIAAALRGRGVNVLRNEGTGFARGGDTAYIVGIEPLTGTSTPISPNEIAAALPEGASVPLLLSNLPTVLPNLPSDRFPLVLSGNTFCGEVGVPGTPRFAELVEGPLANARVPRAYRLFRANDSVLFITCGTGFSFVPVRWGSPAEVAIVTLLRIPEQRATTAPDTLLPQ